VPDYFVVGPTLLLRADSDADPLRLRVYAEGRCTGCVVVVSSGDGRAQISTDVGARRHVEALRLAARIAVRQTAARTDLEVVTALPLREADRAKLLSDGFFPCDGRWVRPAAPFLRTGAKADTMEAVYLDPFTIPWNFVGREHDVLERALRAATGTRVLDLGCGFGKNATFLEERGFDVHGIDVAATAIARCRELVRQPEAYVAGSATDLPWEDGRFDVVLDIGCVHCLAGHERPRAVAQARRVLRSGGVLISRLFRSRPADWVDRQPFAATGFGVEPTAARSLFSRCFENVAMDVEPDMIYVEAKAHD
jgi:SAM-dependent methyltransferase